MKYIFKLGIC